MMGLPIVHEVERQVRDLCCSYPFIDASQARRMVRVEMDRCGEDCLRLAASANNLQLYPMPPGFRGIAGATRLNGVAYYLVDRLTKEPHTMIADADHFVVINPMRPE